jgi:hypothetical protein
MLTEGMSMGNDRATSRITGRGPHVHFHATAVMFQDVRVRRGGCFTKELVSQQISVVRSPTKSLVEHSLNLNARDGSRNKIVR